MKRILPVLIFLAGAMKTMAQGCSDAGVCTIHSIKDNTEKTVEEGKNNNELSIGFSFGKGERSTSVYSSYVEYTRILSRRTSVTGKVGFAVVRGELGNTSGPGDLFLSISHSVDIKSKWHKSVVAGLKIPLDRSDIVKKEINLPMPYQTSLGTTDLVLGLSLARSAFGATVAIQQPLQAVNGNRFLPGDYPSNELAAKYLPTNRFFRKGDALLRLSWIFHAGEKLAIRPSLLGIYHLADDSYRDMMKTRITIPGSKGLTLNGNIFFDYKLNKVSQFEISLGAPFVVRKNRPDGLTRSFVAAIEYKFSF